MNTNNSTEDYLRTILSLQNSKGCVRAIDVATDMGVTKPTVSVTMKRLRELQMIYIDPKGHICLTENGRSLAEEVSKKHMLINKVLIGLGVSPKTAAQEARLIERAIGEETFERLEEFYEREFS